MKIFFVIIFLFVAVSSFNYLLAKSALPGTTLFYNLQGKYGSCNTCHTNGGSAGRWDFETMSIDPEEGRKIPSLKGIGERKNQEEIERSIKLMEKLFAFKLTNEQRSQLAEYLGTL